MDETATSYTHAETRRKISLIIQSIWIQQGLKARLRGGVRHTQLVADDHVSPQGWSCRTWAGNEDFLMLAAREGWFIVREETRRSGMGDAASVLRSKVSSLPWVKITGRLGTAKKRCVYKSFSFNYRGFLQSLAVFLIGHQSRQTLPQGLYKALKGAKSRQKFLVQGQRPMAKGEYAHSFCSWQQSPGHAGPQCCLWLHLTFGTDSGWAGGLEVAPLHVKWGLTFFTCCILGSCGSLVWPMNVCILLLAQQPHRWMSCPQRSCTGVSTSSVREKGPCIVQKWLDLFPRGEFRGKTHYSPWSLPMTQRRWL